MITFLITLTVIAGYLIIGAGAARLMRPAILNARIKEKEWHSEFPIRGGCNHYYSYVETVDRGRILGWTWGMVLAWPVCTWVFAINRSTMQAADKVDPAIHQALEWQIQELEKELGMKET